MIGFTLNNSVDKPIYIQLFESISSQILNGDLEGDYLLPSIRTAALELRVSIITIKKAWEELERVGLIYTITGKGCFVNNLSLEEKINKKINFAKEQMVKDLIYYKNIGLNKNQLLELIDDLFI